MKFRTGDRVKFLNDTGSGEIVSFIDRKTALVRIEDDFEVPVMLTDLVADQGAYYPDEDDGETGFMPAPSPGFEGDNPLTDPSSSDSVDFPEITDDEEVLLALVPGKGTSEFKVYLVNSSTYHLKYIVSRNVEGEQVLFSEGGLEPGLKILLGKYTPANLQDTEVFRVQALFYNDRFYIHMDPVNSVFRMEIAEMYDSENWQTNDYFDEKALIHTLYDWKKKESAPMPEIDPEEIRKAMFSKGDIAAEKKKEESPGTTEIDLHIENLTDDHRHLSNAEILDIQLSRFRTSLETAMLHGQKRIVFIHGVGNGKLKHELRRTLDREYRKLRYQDASFREYGYGATMVLLR